MLSETNWNVTFTFGEFSWPFLIYFVWFFLYDCLDLLVFIVCFILQSWNLIFWNRYHYVGWPCKKLIFFFIELRGILSLKRGEGECKNHSYLLALMFIEVILVEFTKRSNQQCKRFLVLLWGALSFFSTLTAVSWKLL